MLFYVYALIPTSTGELIAGGSFLRAGDTNAAHVARWNGSEWSPMGSGVGGPVSSSDRVYSLAVLPNGDVVAAGLFTQAGGTPVGHIARWNGSSWLPLGGGVSGSASTFVTSLGLLPDGRLVAGGSFTSAGGVPASNIAVWDGANWSACGSGLNGAVDDIAITSEGEILAGGAFTSAGGVLAGGVAVWSGSSWSAVGAGLQAYVSSVLVLPGEKFIAGGYFFPRSNDDRCEGLAQWDGARWTPVGGGISCPATSLVSADSDGFIVGGGIPWAEGAPTERVAWWDGTSWSALDDGFGGGREPCVHALNALDDGSVVVGGSFTSAGGTPANSIARWSTSGWQAMGSGVEGGDVYALATLADGGIVAGGTFTTAGGVPVNRIARWDGDRWLPLGSGFEGPDARVHALAALPDGDLIACGYFTSAGGVSAQHIARWDGVHWNPLGEGVAYSHRLSEASIAAVVVLPDGGLVVAGGFDVAGGVPANGVAKWDGAAWHPLGGGPPWSQSLAVLADGSILAGRSSSLSSQPAVYRWDGVQWSPFGTELFTDFSKVHAIVPMANGEVLIAGSLQLIGSLSDNIRCWNGTQWMPLGTGLRGGGGGRARALALLANGDIAVGGEFVTAGGAVSARFARYSFGSDCCDPIDFNGDELFPDTQDIADFLLVFGGGACPTTACDDIDFNNDGLFPDTLDIQAFLSVFSGGECVQ